MKNMGLKEAKSESVKVQGQNALRVKVAELCGWELKDTETGWYQRGTEFAHVLTLPLYESDLNACAEFEETLQTEEQCAAYAVELAKQVKGFPHDPFTGVSGYMWHATAEQRCRAFIATMERGICP